MKKLIIKCAISFTVFTLAFTSVGLFYGWTTRVVGNSMYPTLKNGETYHASRIGAAEIERGTIVVAKDDQGGWVVKRVIGLPGETVRFLHGQVYVNSRLLVEPYLAAGQYTAEDWKLGDKLRAGPGEYILLGDNRTNSYDSRFYGAVPSSRIRAQLDITTQSPRLVTMLAHK